MSHTRERIGLEIQQRGGGGYSLKHGCKIKMYHSKNNILSKLTELSPYLLGADIETNSYHQELVLRKLGKSTAIITP